MKRAVKKGMKLIDNLKNSMSIEKMEDMQDFYLRKQNTTFAIRNVEAYHIKGTDTTIVLGVLDHAQKTAHLAKKFEQPQQISEPIEPKKEEEPKVMYTEEDISVVMTQGSVTREEAEKVLKENNGDSLSALMALGK